jgi:hypothetical protein
MQQRLQMTMQMAPTRPQPAAGAIPDNSNAHQQQQLQAEELPDGLGEILNRILPGMVDQAVAAALLRQQQQQEGGTGNALTGATNSSATPLQPPAAAEVPPFTGLSRTRLPPPPCLTCNPYLVQLQLVDDFHCLARRVLLCDKLGPCT